VPVRLSWADLLIENAARDYRVLLEDWSWLLKEPFHVIAGNKFGDWFIQRPDGSVEILDSLDGTLRPLAPTPAEFRRLINTQEKQEEWLLSHLVFTLHEKRMIPADGQCYAFRVPPILGGKVEADNVEVMDLAVWVSVCGQLHRQVQALPPGTKVTGFKVTE
jgi:hypothetical protein